MRCRFNFFLQFRVGGAEKILHASTNTLRMYRLLPYIFTMELYFNVDYITLGQIHVTINYAE